jgi:hypothetical protein
MATTMNPVHQIDGNQPLSERMTVDEYNFEHFRLGQIVADAKRSIANLGVQPGTLAPDFDLPLAGGGRVQLSALRGKPVLLHFGSCT